MSAAGWMACAALLLGGDDVQVSPGDQWRGLRGEGSGWTSAVDLPTEWEAAAWETETPGYGQSCPVVAGGKVFVTSIEGAEKELGFVTCLRLEDGLPLWIRSFEAPQRITNSNMVSRAAPSPAVDGERVYAFFESGDLRALDHAGREVWRRDLFARYGPFEGNHGVGSSLVRAGDVLVLLLDHAGPSHLLAFDPETGADAWVVEREPRVSWSTPVYASGPDGGELVVSSNGTVEGFALRDGALRWRVEGIEGNTVPSPTVVGEHVVVARSKGAGVALVARPSEAGADARLLWPGDSLAPSGFGSPLVRPEAILLVNKAGVLSSVDRETGEQHWRERLSCGGVWASPVACGELTWFFGKEGRTSVVRWTAEGPEEVSVNEVEGVDGVHGVAAVDGTFVVREPGRVLCFRAPVEPAEDEEEPVATEEDAPSPPVRKIWDRAPHCAFTDLVRHEGRYYCAFREGAGHVPKAEGEDGVIRVLVSADGTEWTSFALLEEEGVDLRDPKLSITPDGLIMLLASGSVYEGRELQGCRTRVAFVGDDGRFGPWMPILVDPRVASDRDWLWRVTWRGEHGYGVLYQTVEGQARQHLLRTLDGIRYELVSTWDLPGRPNETTLRFLSDGRMVAVVRNEIGERGHVGTSAAPYEEWGWVPIARRLGGPELLVLEDDTLLLGTRRYRDEGNRTELCHLRLNGEVTTLRRLPSGGDTSYPGLIQVGDEIWMSYYSSHEGGAAVYLARFERSELGVAVGRDR